MKYFLPSTRMNPATQRFMFATGIECSYPMVKMPRGIWRVEEMQKCSHYGRWQEDLQLTRDLGIRFLRYGPPWYRMHSGSGQYDWAWTDIVLPEMQKLNITPIIDLCHFG